jgi:CRISPR/Cas system-associated exonuclease Cas4 (RecB family)
MMIYPAKIIPNMLAVLSNTQAAALARALSAGLTASVRRSDPVPPRRRFWASDPFTCRRKVAFSFSDLPRDPTPPRIEETWSWGNLYHQEYGRRLRRIPGITIIAEEQDVVVRPDGLSIPIKGRFDFLAAIDPARLAAAAGSHEPDLPHDTVRVIIDIKSTSGFGMRGVLSDGPRRPDLAEITVYLHAIRADLGLLVYHDRDRNEREIVPVSYSPDLFHEIVAWLADVEQAITSGRPAPPDFNPLRDTYPCGSCPFRTRCAAIEQAAAKVSQLTADSHTP